jgi:hypothetical protein
MGRAAYAGFPCVDEFVTLPGEVGTWRREGKREGVEEKRGGEGR